MRILHIITSTDRSLGGPIEGIIQLNQGLSAQGHTTEVVCVDAPDAPWLGALPIKVHAVGPARLQYGYSGNLIPWLRRHAGAYDAVVVNGIWQFPSFAAWLALNRSEVPYFVFTHGMLDPWFKRTYPLKHLKKCLYWPWAEYRVLRDARAVCFTCEEERMLARQSFGLYRCREAVVNYGTAGPSGDPAAQRKRFFEQFPELRAKRLLLFLSRIHVKKGCDLLIEAFARVADRDRALHLVMAGPDQTGWQGQLQRQAEGLGIADRITWTGMLTGDLKWGAFYAAEAFVLPSHQENFGIAIAEALSCGLPVLISNKVNIWREIEADGAGLVAEDDAEGAAQMLQRWISLPSEDRRVVAKKARQCFAERFEIHKAAQSLVHTLCAHKA